MIHNSIILFSNGIRFTIFQDTFSTTIAFAQKKTLLSNPTKLQKFEDGAHVNWYLHIVIVIFVQIIRLDWLTWSCHPTIEYLKYYRYGNFFEIISPFECGKHIFCHYTYKIAENFVTILTENGDVFKQLVKRVKINNFFSTEYDANQYIECKICVLIPVKKNLSCIGVLMYIVNTMVIIMRANLLMIRWNRLGTSLLLRLWYFHAFRFCMNIENMNINIEKKNFDRYSGTLKKILTQHCSYHRSIMNTVFHIFA